MSLFSLNDSIEDKEGIHTFFITWITATIFFIIQALSYGLIGVDYYSPTFGLAIPHDV